MQSLAGTIWKVVAARAFDQAGRTSPSPLGPHPQGIVMFEVERMMGVIADGRPSMPADVPTRFFVAYTGPYSFDGERLITRADDASKPELLGEQIRLIRFESPTRMVVMPISGALGGSGIELVWERVG